jgi:opacity protein-like surface antigen
MRTARIFGFPSRIIFRKHNPVSCYVISFKRIIIVLHMVNSNTMKRLWPLFFCLPFTASAQNFHFSARLGLAGYNGDLKAHSITLSQTKLMGSLGVQYDLTEHLTARSYFTLTSLKADDKMGTASMQQRNLNFQTKLFDWELSAQYHLFSLNNRWWTPYLFAGIGLYHFNPYTKDESGGKVFLKPLSTEGQGFRSGFADYKLTSFSLPMGMGLSYALNEDMRLGLEFGYRKIFTDYLDDVSNSYADKTQLLNTRGQTAVDLAWRADEINATPYPVAGTGRGNPNQKDGYYFIAITYTIRYFFDKYKQIVGLPSGSREKKVGCPSTRN